MQRKKLENNKEKLINLSQNYRKLLLNEITIPNRKLLLQKKTSMGIQFVESMPVFFSKFSNWKVIAFLTIFPLSICFLNKIKEQNDRNEIKINIKSHSASLCLYTQFMLHSPYCFSNLFVLTRSSFILLYPYKSTHFLLLTDTLSTVLPPNGILMQKVGCF